MISEREVEMIAINGRIIRKKGKVINMKINQLRTAFAAVLFGLVLILGGQSAKAETKDVSGRSVQRLVQSRLRWMKSFCRQQCSERQRRL